MDEIQNHGHEGADNSSNETQSKLYSSASTLYQQSRYIGAIAVSLGFIGLAGPVIDERGGMAYEFDFYYPEKPLLIKVFSGFDEAAWDKYSNHPDQPLIILDSETCGFTVKGELGIDGPVLIAPESIDEITAAYDRVFAYYSGGLWEQVAEEGDRVEWLAIMPAAVRFMRSHSGESEK